MERFRLIASIMPIIKLKASEARNIILKASFDYSVSLKASVVTFSKSLTTKANIIGRIFLNVKAYVYKKISNTNIFVKTYLKIKSKVIKYAKSLIYIETYLFTSMIVRKNAKAIIGFNPIVGKSSILSLIKNKTLGDIKDITLKDLTFAVGVRAFVIKKLNILTNPTVFVSIVAKVFRKTRLGDIKTQTLGTIKTKTLMELVEYEV